MHVFLCLCFKNRVDMEGNSDNAGEFQVYDHQQQQQEAAAAAEEGTVSIHDCTAETTSTILPWPALLIPPTTPPPPPSLLTSFYHDLYGARRPFQFAYDRGGPSSSSGADPMGLAALYNCSNYLGSAGGRPGMLMSSTAAAPFEMGKMTAQEIMDAKALAASKSHSEAERRRRERINAHLARLRSLLPSTTKTDKASLLAEVIQHVKELKRQTSEIAEESSLPTETDELTVVSADEVEGSGGSPQSLVRAALCCDDRADLLPDLIKALKALKLRSLKADITTLAGRIKIVLLIAHDIDDHHLQLPSLAAIQDALKGVMERAATPASASSSAAEDSSATISKRQRTAAAAGLPSILEHRSA
ncbi:transcription factor bHLH30-like [Zingiber officinale]|uniref:transcription factor bHLH30-like n=1 Tax=Zingiber officinale TaxID=94328 RepID=UPI001C4C7762|nr:transcription factor bHLH30-like [Zingiber officinale]